MKYFRVKCECGQVADVTENTVCAKCGKPVADCGEGEVYIYRMGSPIGMAVGYGIYINGAPYGHLANKQTIRVPLPYGTYTFHFTCSTLRRCQDLTITLSPDDKTKYVKGHIKPGFWTNKIIIEEAKKEEMPLND